MRLTHGLSANPVRRLRPVKALFFGSELELLATLVKQCPLIDKDYVYYKQTLKQPLVIGQEFARFYQQWAWGTGKNQFPADMFSDQVSEQAYIKYAIAKHLALLTPTKLSEVADEAIQAEIAALRANDDIARQTPQPKPSDPRP